MKEQNYFYHNLEYQDGYSDGLFLDSSNKIKVLRKLNNLTGTVLEGYRAGLFEGMLGSVETASEG